MNSFETGRKAERVACDYLVRQGCRILAQNWRTRRCEIDIVAQRDDSVFCCEVKYRRSNVYGSGTEAVTPKKLRQMQFAATLWAHMHQWSGQLQLVVIEVSGADFRITAVIKNVS